MKESNLPIIIDRTDLALDNLTINGGEECDCACPDNGFTFDLRIDTKNHLLVRSNLYSAHLIDEYELFFNPVHDAGVIVLNKESTDLLDLFKNPTAIEDLSASSPNRRAITRMSSLGLLEPKGNQLFIHKQEPRTLSAWLHVTNECNLRCEYCYINKTQERMQHNVGFASVDAILRSAISGNFRRIKIKYAGGEATLNLPLVFELNKYAKNKASEAGLEFESTILSNGVVLSESSIKKLLKQNIRLMISLDGIGNAHNVQRKFINGRGSFDWVNRTITRTTALGLMPFISITVTDLNVDNLPETVAYVLSRGLPFNINFYRDTECAHNSEDLRLHDDRIILAMKNAFKVIEANLPPYSLLGMLVDRSSFGQSHDKTCGVGESYMVINQKGGIAKCHMEIEKPITSIYENDPLSFIRMDSIGIQNLSVEKKEGCRDCEWRYWCTGGCPLLTYKTTGRYDVKSPYCRVYKSIYPELLRLEGLRLLKYAKNRISDAERVAL